MQLLVLFGFDYTDERLVQLFIEELKQNPQISISSLQRKYSLGFNRAARSLELIDGLRILWKKSDNGTVVAVLPFPNVAKALQRNESHQKIGEFLAEKVK
ncbi:DNA translocase FtsK [Bibersteinia trehalosi]|uniref:DNA translocase FtsK n=1 Tax=Bibersteinia trehalosi TaxID=47735 RepID=UPI0040452F60